MWSTYEMYAVVRIGITITMMFSRRNEKGKNPMWLQIDCYTLLPYFFTLPFETKGKVDVAQEVIKGFTPHTLQKEEEIVFLIKYFEHDIQSMGKISLNSYIGGNVDPSNCSFVHKFEHIFYIILYLYLLHRPWNIILIYLT